jgi:hypothetical protein
LESAAASIRLMAIDRRTAREKSRAVLPKL